MTVPSITTTLRSRARCWLLVDLNQRLHTRALTVYAVVVASHFFEHVAQIVQVFALGWARPDAGGLLGLYFPGLVMAEVLHTSWNSLQLTGLILLLPGFSGSGRAAWWWRLALALQTWHWFEHAFIQVQYATGIYFYGAIMQMSVLERFVPRIELHFAYNLLVFVPTVAAAVLLLRARHAQAPHDRA
jgi:hypothetical protein